MSLRNLDYLTTKEGQIAISVALTQFTNIVEKGQQLQSMDEVDLCISDAVKDVAEVVGDSADLIKVALKELYIGQGLAQYSVVNALRANGGELTAIQLIAGMLYGASNCASTKDESTEFDMMTKRDFIRLAVLIYDLNQITIRNNKMLATGQRIS